MSPSTDPSIDPGWFQLPPFGPVAAHPRLRSIAQALHAEMRRQIPYLYFRDPKRYADLRLTIPMLVYQSSTPYAFACGSRRSSTLLHYDVLNASAMERLFYHSRARLFGNVRAARSAAIAANLDAAKFYDPSASTAMLRRAENRVIYRRPLNQMLTGEARLLEELARLPGATDAKEQHRRAVRLHRAWGVTLRRFCGSLDFTPTIPALLQAATKGMLCDLANTLS